MRYVWIVHLVLLVFASTAFGLELSTRVHDVEISERIDEPILVFLASGHVGKLAPGNKFLDVLLDARRDQNWVKIILNEEREITEIEIIEGPPVVGPESYKSGLVAPPSVLGSMALAQRLFSEAKHKDKESQCFNRAHIWSYEWKKKNFVNTDKLFIFFTARYIREHDFHWWFHVAPLAHVAIGPDIKERVMDRKYLKGPGSIREWIDSFMEKGTKCRTVRVYSEYANYPEGGECFLMRTDMYTYWPLDLELEELYGKKKLTWVDDEIKQAYLEAFDINI